MNEPSIHLLRALRCEAVLAQVFRVLLDNVELMIHNGAVAECEDSFEVLRKMSDLLDTRSRSDGMEHAATEAPATGLPAAESVTSCAASVPMAALQQVATTREDAPQGEEDDWNQVLPPARPTTAHAPKARHCEPEVNFWSRFAQQQAEEAKPLRSATVVSLVPNTGSTQRAA